MKIYRTRYNFATNSSSSHSLVRIPEDQDLSPYEDNLPDYEHYGRSEFTLVSLEEKLRYVATQFKEKLDLSDEEIELLKTLPEPLSEGIDHQSQYLLCHLNLSEAIQMVSDDRILIIGGDDSDQHVYEDYEKVLSDY